MFRKWDRVEVSFLRENYSETNKDELLKNFNKRYEKRSWISIFKKANKLGLRKPNFKKDIDKILLKKYSNTQMDSLLKEIKVYIPNINKIALIARANRLGLNRKAYASKQQEKEIKIPKPSEKFAWFLGVLAGDGYVSSLTDKSKSYKTQLTVISKKFLEEFRLTGEKLFGIKPIVRKYNKYKLNGVWRKYHECVFVSKRLVAFLGDWREENWIKTLKLRFPWVLGNNKFIATFISGFFDSDGSAIYDTDRPTRRITFAIKHKKTQAFVKQMLEKFGIKSKIYYNGLQLDGIENVKKTACIIESCIPHKKKVILQLRNL